MNDPIFLGEAGDGVDTLKNNPEYWHSRMNYWKNCKKPYPREVLGYQMLIDGRAKYRDDGKVEWHPTDKIAA